VALAREVAGDAAWVAASVGPVGQLLEPYGALTLAEVEEAYAEQVACLQGAGADLVLIETMTDMEEASAALRMAKRHTDLPVFITFSFNAGGRTIMGLRPEIAAARSQAEGADAVGANCGEGPQAVLAALEGMNEATDLPLIAQANAGVPTADLRGQAVWDVTPEEMVQHVRQFVAQGARVVGGCCGSGPAHIAAMVEALGQ
jgi:5-methyltetrahydrofolate--homocysteine methyltransferase